MNEQVDALHNKTVQCGSGGFEGYDEYKESDIDWVGNIPDYWDTAPLRAAIDSWKGGKWGEDPDGQNDLVCLRVEDFDRFRARVETSSPTIRSVAPRYRPGRLVKNGDLLLEKSGGGEKQPVGFCVLVERLSDKAICSIFITRLSVKDNISSNFLRYLFYHLYEAEVNTRCIKQTTGIQNLDVNQYLSTTVAFPPKREQDTVARFLDEQTALTAELIEQKKRLIELLQERRTALITRAVTKGLDPDASVKDSGVDWLGAIPSHWDVRQLRYLGEFSSGSSITSAKMEEDGAYPVYGGNGIRGFCESYTHEGTYPIIGRQGALAGNVNYADGKFWASEHAVVVTPRQEIEAYWLGEVLRAMNLNQYADAAAQAGLAVSDVVALKAPCPPENEQKQIAGYLQKLKDNTEYLKAQLNRGISLLEEYRSSLITACVTGKIDVRDHAA